jgi:Apoptosis-antagonizing transcription factor, C-terminal
MGFVTRWKAWERTFEEEKTESIRSIFLSRRLALVLLSHLMAEVQPKTNAAIVRSLIDLRVKLQPILKNVNRIPTGMNLADMDAGLKENMSSLLIEALMFHTKNVAFTEKMINQRKRKYSAFILDTVEDETFSSADPDPVLFYTSLVSPGMEKIREYALEQLDGWKKETRLNKATDLNTLEQSVSDEVAFLMADSKILQKTRPGVNKYTPIVENGKKLEVEQIFDDTVLYASLLKQVLSGDDPSLLTSKDFSKKKDQSLIDRRATKGRKLKYTVIDKLVSFMAPEPPKNAVTDISYVDMMVQAIFQ